MTLMQLIKSVLDDIYVKIHIREEAAKDGEIKQEIDCLSKDYKRLTDTSFDCIDYSDPIKRFAYIYKYTVAHADYIMQLIEMTDELSDLFSRSDVDVACLGGGPGSEFLGILKYMIAAQSKSTLSCQIFDRERAWGDSWGRIARRTNADFRVFPVFQQLDVTNSSTWSSYEDYLQSDLFTLSFFISEMYRFASKAEPFFTHCFSRARSGAIFLFIDNADSRFHGWFDYLTSRCKFRTLGSGAREFAFSNDEEKRDLGPYFDKFGWPKRKSDAAYRILCKE